MGRSKEFEEKEVLQKAMEIFWQKGYEKTSMSDLVEYMGIHRKSIYDTFGDKHALYLRAIDQYNDFNNAKLKEEIFQATTSYQALQKIFNHMIERNADKSFGCLLVNATTECGPFDFEVLQKTENSFIYAETFIADIIKKGQENGEFSLQYDNIMLSEIIHNTLLGLRVLVKTSASKEKMNRIVNFYLDLIKK